MTDFETEEDYGPLPAMPLSTTYYVMVCKTRYDALRAENERLREALKPYAEYTNWSTYATVDRQYVYWTGDEADPSCIAHAALEANK